MRENFLTPHGTLYGQSNPLTLTKPPWIGTCPNLTFTLYSLLDWLSQKGELKKPLSFRVHKSKVMMTWWRKFFPKILSTMRPFHHTILIWFMCIQVGVDPCCLQSNKFTRPRHKPINRPGPNNSNQNQIIILFSSSYHLLLVVRNIIYLHIITL